MQPQLLLVEVLRGRVIANLGAIGKAEQSRVDGLEGPDAGPSGLQGLPELDAVADPAPR